MRQLPTKTGRVLHLLLALAVLLLPMQGMTAERPYADRAADTAAEQSHTVSHHLAHHANDPHHHAAAAQHTYQHNHPGCHNPASVGDHCASCGHYCAIQQSAQLKLPGKTGDEYQQFSAAVITVSLPQEIRPPIV